MMLGGLGGLGVWSFARKIDEAEERADDAFFAVKDNVERRSGLSGLEISNDVGLINIRINSV